MLVIASNLFWLTACVYFEARSEPVEGQKAVVHVVMNRVHNRGISVEDVVRQRYQFSWYNGGFVPDIRNWSAFVQCAESVLIALKEREEGETLQRADHYFADYIPMPNWAKDMKKITKIGHHIFYRAR